MKPEISVPYAHYQNYLHLLGKLSQFNIAPGEIISVDIIGKISPPATNGHKYFFLFADVALGINMQLLAALNLDSQQLLRMLSHGIVQWENFPRVFVPMPDVSEPWQKWLYIKMSQ